MTKPTIKSSSHSLSQVTRPKIEFLIHKKSHPKLYQASYNSDCSPYLIWTLMRKNAQQNPAVLLFKNSNKNAPSLGDLAEAASTQITSIESALNKLDQVFEDLKSTLSDLDNLNIYPETSLNLAKKLENVSTDFSDSSFKNFSIEELQLLSESLDDDFSEQTIPGHDANNSDITK